MKYYSVYKGKSGVPKIFTSWDECKKEVTGVKGAIYKSFKTEAEAIEFLHLNSQSGGSSAIKKDEVGGSSDEEFLNSGLIIFVDGSFMLEKGNYSYGLVAVNNGEVIYEDSGIGEDSSAIALRNVSGEVMGAMKAVEFALKREELREGFIEYLNTKPWENE